MSFLVSLALCCLLSPSALASPWKRQAESNPICLWKHPRAAIIRDTLFVDGGWIYSKNATQNYPTTATIQTGQIYSINFTRPFTLSSDASGIFQVKSSTNGPSNNFFENFYDGAMFTNDNEYVLYGGVTRQTAAYVPPSADSYTTFEQYQYGPVRQIWAPGPVQGRLPSGITRYITSGAGVSVPSENLGFYFSGLHGKDWGNITSPTSTSPSNATIVADTLISVDMSVMRTEKWSNDTLPSSAPGRISGEAVWVPASNRGALIVFGGVSDSYDVWKNGLNANQTENSKSKSPGYMKTVQIYDVDAKKWYSQETSGDIPPQLAEACSVVASAKDNSSHNVYLYGGYDALTEPDHPNDDVYILSIPSFIWVKAVTGKPSHGRNGHRCVKPYPDQMFVIGGNSAYTDETATCLEGGAVQIFNLNTLKWQDSYDPSKWSPYKVPSIVTAKIGGSADGGATSTGPSAWSNSDLQTLLSAKYSKSITAYYPYPSVKPSSSTATPTPSSSSNGLPKWAAILIGVLVGLIGLCIILAIALLWLRHKHMKRLGSSEAGGSTTENGMMSWLRGIPAQGPVKGGTATETESDDVTSEGGGVSSPGGYDPLSPTKSETVEAQGNPVAELADTSSPVELASPVIDAKPRSADAKDAFDPPPSFAGIPRADSPITGAPAIGSIDERTAVSNTSPLAVPSTTPVSPNIPKHSHSHSRSISSDLGPTSPLTPESERPASPISPPESARTSLSAAVPVRGLSSASAVDKRARRQSSFSEIME